VWVQHVSRDPQQSLLQKTQAVQRPASCQIRDLFADSADFVPLAVYGGHPIQLETPPDYGDDYGTKSYKRLSAWWNPDEQAELFVPLEYALDGVGALAKLKTLAATHAVTACQLQTYCTNAISSYGESRDRIRVNFYATCMVTILGGQKSFPKDCKIQAFTSGKRNWILATRTFKIQTSTIDDFWPPEPNHEVQMAAESNGISDEALISAATLALQKPPFVFEQRLDRGSSLLAIGGHRPSQTLVGWFEWPSVAITAYELTLHIDCSLEVNKYNTDRPEDWHLASQTQASRYCGLLIERVAQQAKSVCQKGFGVYVGTDKIECRIASPDPGQR